MNDINTVTKTTAGLESLDVLGLERVSQQLNGESIVNLAVALFSQMDETERVNFRVLAEVDEGREDRVEAIAESLDEQLSESAEELASEICQNIHEQLSSAAACFASTITADLDELA